MTVEERAQKFIQTWYGDPCISPHAVDGMRQDFIQALRDQIEDCAKVADQEVHRLDSISMKYKQKGDLEIVVRTSACTLTAGKLGRDIRALAGQTDQTEGKDGNK